MIFSDLKSRVLGVIHRADIANQVVLFAADATERINRRLNLTLAPLVNDSDTNEVLTQYPLLYQYATLQSAYEYLNNGDNASYYADKWETECDRQNVTQNATTDNYVDEPPVIESAE